MHAVDETTIEDSPVERLESFEREALVHLAEVYRVACVLARDATVAEDLTQETMLKAWRAWDRFRTGTNARAWLVTILRHTYFTDATRVRRRARLLDEATTRESASVFEQLESTDPEGRFFREIVDEEVLRAIEELPDQHRETVVLSDLHDFSYADIAKITQAPLGTVKSRLFRARQLLQERLHEYAMAMGYVSPTPVG